MSELAEAAEDIRGCLSVEEPKKNPLEREELKQSWYQKPGETLGVRKSAKVVEARHAGDHEDYRTGRP
jgi:hypothetical protein